MTTAETVLHRMTYLTLAVVLFLVGSAAVWAHPYLLNFGPEWMSYETYYGGKRLYAEISIPFVFLTFACYICVVIAIGHAFRWWEQFK